MDIEPLDTDLWFAALERLEQRLNAGSECHLGQALRHAFHLQQLAPRWLRGLVRARLGELEYEELLEAGSYEAAANALVGAPLSHVIERCDGHFVDAAIYLPGAAVPVTSRATSRPAAVLAAWLRCLQTLKDHSSARLEELGCAASHERLRTRPSECVGIRSRRASLQDLG